MLFAAGKGERLRPLTERLPKPALPLLDIPLGTWGLAALSALRPTIVNASHLPHSVVNSLGSHGDGVRFFVEEPQPFGTGGTLAALSANLDDPVLCWNADMLTDLDAAALWDAHSTSDFSATIAVTPTHARADFLLEGDRAVELIDRRVQTRAGFLYMGAAVFDREAFDLLPKTRPVGLTAGLLHPLLEQGRLGVHVHDGYWVDVGTLDRYLRASLDVLDGRAPRPPTPPPGDVVEVVGGRAYTGPNATVDGDSLGDGAIVLSGAEVERGARVEKAIVLPNEVVSSGTRINDAVWCGGRGFPARARTD